MSAIELESLGLEAIIADEQHVPDQLISDAKISLTTRGAISTRPAFLVNRICDETYRTLTEHFIAEYGLFNREGVAMMCLAAPMLRVPDAFSMDALSEDKIAL